MPGKFILAAVLAAFLITPTTAQVATWKGRQYTPQSFPRALSCGCSMCQSLRAQWSRHSPGAYHATGPAVQLVARPAAPPAPSPAVATSYRIETRTRQVPYRVKVCHGTYCTIETRYKTETYQVRVPVKEEFEPLGGADEVEYRGTDPEVAAAVAWLLCPGPDDVLVDLGCGEGELLAAAEKYGCRLVGVEIDSQRAARAQKNLPEAKIVCGDMLEQTYTHGSIYVAYLFPDLLSEVAKLLPRGAMLASLEHEVPGLDMAETTFEVNGEQHTLYTGVIE